MSMNIDIPRITKPLDLGGYAQEFTGVVVQVWVNPPRDFMRRFFALSDENTAAMKAAEKLKAGKHSVKAIEKATADIQRIGMGFIDWWAELWSQAQDPETHWTRDGVVKLVNSDTDPKLYGWICEHSMQLINEHKDTGKKK